MAVKPKTEKKPSAPEASESVAPESVKDGAYGAPAGMPNFLTASLGAQAKLSVGSADDAAELEADRIGQNVVSGNGAPPSSRRRGNGDMHAPPKQGSSAGQPLPTAAREFFEPRFGADFSGVRIHTGQPADASARGLNAEAYTVGSDIAFRQGKYATDTSDGKRLLAHELTHVVQQNHGSQTRIQRQPTDREVPTASEPRIGVAPFQSTAREWVESNGPQLARELGTQLGSAPISIPIPEMHWRSGPGEFVRVLLAQLGTDGPTLWYQLPNYLRPDSVIDAVNIGRGCYPVLVGTSLWRPGVVDEISRRILLRLVESLGRIAPRAARHQIRDSQPAAQGAASPSAAPASTRRPALTGFSLLLPHPQSISAGAAFSHPIDPYVYQALRTTTETNADAYRANHPEEFTPEAIAADEMPLRPVQFLFLAGQGLPSWIRVTNPENATAEEVANTLYGDPTAASRLIAAPPLFGMPSEDVSDDLLGQRSPSAVILLQGRGAVYPERDRAPFLLLEHRLALSRAIREAGITIGNTTDQDAAQQILRSPLGDNAARLAAARIMPTEGANKALIRERMALIHNDLADMEYPAGQLARPPDSPNVILTTYLSGGQITRMAWEPYVAPATTAVRGRLEAARTRIFNRFQQIDRGTEADALLWDGQSRGQLEIVTTALHGISFAAGLAERFRGWPNIYELIKSLADGYVSAAEISDFYPAARERLDAAERRSVLFPATAMELWLAQIRTALNEARRNKMTAVEGNNPATRYGINDLDRLEQSLRDRLAQVRAQLLQNPNAAQATLQTIFHELQDLQTGASIAVDLDTVDRVWQALYDSISFMGEVRAIGGGGNARISRALDGANRLRRDWERIMDRWRTGDREGARQEMEEKAHGQEWPFWVSNMTELIRDQQEWDALMTFVAMVGIAILSAGIGAYVEAGVGAAWGVGAGASGWVEVGAAGVGVVTEAGVFTALSYPMTARDPSLGGAAEQFGQNVLFFGAGRVLAGGFQALLGQAGAATAGGRLLTGVGVGAAFTGANLLMANEQSQRERRRGLSTGEAEKIGLENVAFMAVTTLASALLHRPLANLRIQGELTGMNFRYKGALGSLETTMTEFRSTPAPNEALRQRLITHTQEALVAEQNLMNRMRELVINADAMVDAAHPETAGARDRQLARLGITTELATQLRSAAVPSEVLAGLRVMQGVRISRALEPAGSDFFIRGDMYEESLAYFRSLPDTVVIDSRAPRALVVDPAAAAAPRIEPGGDSFIVRPANEAPFRVYKRAPGAVGDVAGRPELAPSVEAAAAARDPMARPAEPANPAQPGGGRAGASPIDWGLPPDAIEGVRRALLQRGDIGSVHQSMRDAGVRASREQIQAAKSYLFDSRGIQFDRANYEAWQRLADGRGQVRDIAFLVHELAEIGALEQIGRRTGFDYRGANIDSKSATERRQWQADFNRYYLQAHSEALAAEYAYVAEAVSQATGGRVAIGRNIAASVDPTRGEARQNMMVDGLPLAENRDFPTWQARGAETKEIGRAAQQRLRLTSSTPTLAELVGAVKRSAGGPESATRGVSLSLPAVSGAIGRRGATGATAGNVRTFTPIERARQDRIADYLDDHGLDWGDLFRSGDEVNAFFDQYPTTADALNALETRARRVVDLRGSAAQSRSAGGSESGGSRLNPFDEPPSATQVRAAATGEATGGARLPRLTGALFDLTRGRVAAIPGQVAQRMRGMTFQSWGDFRETLWRMMYQDPAIRAQFTPSNQTRMSQGLAPIVGGGQATGGGVNARLQLNHRRPIEQGGGVFDLDNIEIVTPLAHQGLGAQ